MTRTFLFSIGLAVAFFLSCNGVLRASLVTFNTFDANGTRASTNVGAFAVTQSVGDPTVYSFSRTGNLDGGTVNDTLSFDFVYTMFTGSSFNGTNVTLGSSVALADLTNTHYMNNYVGDSNTNQVATGDSFSASITNISYTSGEGFNTPGVSFDGFNSLSKFGGGDADVYIGTTNATTAAVGTGNGPVSLGGVTNLVLTASGNSNQRWRDLNFTFTVPDAIAVTVPEPSSATMFLIGSLICLRRRRAGR